MIAENITKTNCIDTDLASLADAGWYQWAVIANYSTVDAETKFTNALHNEGLGNIKDRHISNSPITQSVLIILNCRLHHRLHHRL